jgi:hypothetical protein
MSGTGSWVAQHFELDQVVAVEQFARQAQRAHRVVGGVAAGGVGQDGVAVRRQHVEQVGLARVLADVGAADRHGDDLAPAASMASRVSAKSLYLPVPTSRREHDLDRPCRR